jgi:hypothetical protein
LPYSLRISFANQDGTTLLLGPKEPFVIPSHHDGAHTAIGGEGVDAEEAE